MTTLKAGMIITEIVTFETIICYKCHVPFAVTNQHKAKLIRDKESFYCPNGHSQAYQGESDEIKLARVKKENELLSQTNKDLAKKLFEEREQVSVYVNKYLDQMNKAKKVSKQLKRVFNGVCPCCNRTFKNLFDHMQTKHKSVASAIESHPLHKKISSKKK